MLELPLARRLPLPMGPAGQTPGPLPAAGRPPSPDQGWAPGLAQGTGSGWREKEEAGNLGTPPVREFHASGL